MKKLQMTTFQRDADCRGRDAKASCAIAALRCLSVGGYWAELARYAAMPGPECCLCHRAFKVWAWSAWVTSSSQFYISACPRWSSQAGS